MVRLVVLFLAGISAFAQAPLRVLLVTGGHDHEPSFYSVFAGQKDIVTNVNPHPVAYNGSLDRYDVIVLYDMVQEIPEPQKARLKAFVESGKGLVVLHHALVSFENWPWYRETTGAQYFEKKSTYKHDVELSIEPVTPHPITRGLGKFQINDETYKGMWISEQNTILLRTNDPTSDGPVAWISPYTKSRVVSIQLGHGSLAHKSPQWQTLVRNAMLWAGGRLQK
jgi:type 1 glutamine amidotransferase